jgi:hypothetical protein
MMMKTMKKKKPNLPTEMPTPEQIEAAVREIEAEDKAARARIREYDPVAAENGRRSQLPSEHPEHIHGMMCDGQDGMNSYCERLRRKLFG